jgi:MFS family permease
MELQNHQAGLKQNWKQFAILVLVNAFVGGMIGMERSIFPQFAEFKFGLDSKLAILSFIIFFGLSKAFANYFAGYFANKFGRKNLLLFGWFLAIPVPFLLMHSPSWNWVVFSNILLGISQGFTWSSTVVMKIDLVGEKNRGFAMGLNEFAGYFALGFTALVTGFIADKFGLTPYPFYIGIFISFLGLIITFFWVEDTRKFVHYESKTSESKSLKNVFIETTFKNKTLSSVTQAGLINNLNDGMIWGLFPILLFSLKFDNSQIGLISSVYPLVWGFGQLFTGRMADIYSKKYMLFFGMLMQALAIIFIPFVNSFYLLIFLAALLGIGTALVYPTFLTTIAQITTPVQRAESIGTFRLWRDLGYAFGAILSGVVADFFGIDYAIIFIGILTLISSIILLIRIP